MTMLAAPTRYTPADVARLSDQAGKLYELVGGALVEKPRMSTVSNWISTQIAHLLKVYYPPARAYVITDQPTYCFDDPGYMRRPDVALVWAARLPGGLTDAEWRVVPDFVVEVTSPTNRYDELHDRVEEYLRAGVPLAAIADPRHRFIHLYRQDGSGQLFRSGDTIAGESALPGFSLRVADCFPPPGSSDPGPA